LTFDILYIFFLLTIRKSAFELQHILDNGRLTFWNLTHTAHV
jgi:hypothetical protein